MHLIQPCCAQKHLLAVRNAIRNGGTTEFEGYGDLSLTELLPPMLTRYAEVEMMIVAPELPEQAAEVIDLMMRKKRARMDGRGNMDVICHLTVVAKLDKEKSDHVFSWLEERPFGDRLTLVDMEQDSTAILLPDFAVTGPVNMRYGYHFVATATTEKERVNALWDTYRAMAENAPAVQPVQETASAGKKAPEESAGKKAARRRSRKRG